MSGKVEALTLEYEADDCLEITEAIHTLITKNLVSNGYELLEQTDLYFYYVKKNKVIRIVYYESEPELSIEVVTLNELFLLKESSR